MINSHEDRQNRRTGTNLQTVPTPQIKRLALPLCLVCVVVGYAYVTYTPRIHACRVRSAVAWSACMRGGPVGTGALTDGRNRHLRPGGS